MNEQTNERTNECCLTTHQNLLYQPGLKGDGNEWDDCVNEMKWH